MLNNFREQALGGLNLFVHLVLGPIPTLKFHVFDISPWRFVTIEKKYFKIISLKMCFRLIKQQSDCNGWWSGQYDKQPTRDAWAFVDMSLKPIEILFIWNIHWPSLQVSILIHLLKSCLFKMFVSERLNVGKVACSSGWVSSEWLSDRVVKK